MIFVLNWSLKSFGLAATAAGLWANDEEAKNFFSTKLVFPPQSSEHEYKWAHLRTKLRDRVEELVVPEPVKKDLVRYVDKVGIELLRWFHFVDCKKRLIEKISRIIWSPHGTINQRRTAELLVQDKKINFGFRFWLACTYCLEKDVRALWHHLRDVRLKVFFPQDMHDDPVVDYWLRAMIGKDDPSKKAHVLTLAAGFSRAIKAGNHVAVSYFFQRLTQDERTSAIKSVISSVKDLKLNQHGLNPASSRQFLNTHYASILCYILNSVDEQKQLDILKKITFNGLVLFLELPYQPLFIEVYKRIGHFLTERDFPYLLEEILHRLKINYKDYDYHQLFIDVLQQTSIDLREFFSNHPEEIPVLLSSFCAVENWVLFNHVLEYVPERREEFLFSQKACEAYKKFVIRDKWNTITSFVTECLESNREKCLFREKMLEFYSLPAFREVCIKLDSLLKDLISCDRKRSIENDERESKNPRLS